MNDNIKIALVIVAGLIVGVLLGGYMDGRNGLPSPSAPSWL